MWDEYFFLSLCELRGACLVAYPTCHLRRERPGCEKGLVDGVMGNEDVNSNPDSRHVLTWKTRYSRITSSARHDFKHPGFIDEVRGRGSETQVETRSLIRCGQSAHTHVFPRNGSLLSPYNHRNFRSYVSRHCCFGSRGEPSMQLFTKTNASLHAFNLTSSSVSCLVSVTTQ